MIHQRKSVGVAKTGVPLPFGGGGCLPQSAIQEVVGLGFFLLVMTKPSLGKFIVDAVMLVGRTR